MLTGYLGGGGTTTVLSLHVKVSRVDIWIKFVSTFFLSPAHGFSLSRIFR